MRFWVDKEQEKKPDDEWKDAYVFSINRKKYSTIFTNITDSWYRMDQMQIPAIYDRFEYFCFRQKSIQKKV